MELYNDHIVAKSEIEYRKSDVNELDKSRILCQIQKTGNTMFRIKEVEIMDEHLKMPISQLNALRREAIEKFEKALENGIQRQFEEPIEVNFEVPSTKKDGKPKINLFLQKVDPNINYESLPYHEIYVPFAELLKVPPMRDCIAVLPSIIEEKYETLIAENTQLLEKVNAIAISHVSQIELLRKRSIKKKMVADNTLNITNQLSEKVIEELGIERFTISPELDKNAIEQFAGKIEKEVVVYGRTCLMTSKYCPIGKNEACQMACQTGKFELKDRKKLLFPVVTDCVNCHAKIYNTKILSLAKQGLDADFVRIDVLDETQEEIQHIISVVEAGERLSGEKYTNGNLYK